jgi:class 3 adenylate cyclase
MQVYPAESVADADTKVEVPVDGFRQRGPPELLSETVCTNTNSVESAKSRSAERTRTRSKDSSGGDSNRPSKQNSSFSAFHGNPFGIRKDWRVFNFGKTDEATENGGDHDEVRSCSTGSVRSSDGALDLFSSQGCAARMCHKVLSNKIVQAYMLILTVAILYLGDIFQATADVSIDTAFTVILYVCVVSFSTEWIMQVTSSALQTPRYNFSLFFYLDLVATLSILLDIIMVQGNDMTSSGPVARAARAARIGTRAGRAMRIVRFVRFIRLVRISRIVKVFTTFNLTRKRKKRDSQVKVDEALAALNETDLEGNIENNSQRADSIGAQIGAATARKVVIMTLMLLALIPILERDQSIHRCNSELVTGLESLYSSEAVNQNCTKMHTAAEPWFGGGSKLLDLTKAEDSGLTKNGLIYAVVHRCVLFSDESMMGSSLDMKATRLVEQRRGTEILAVPCDAVYVDVDGDGTDKRDSTYLLYDMRGEAIEDAWFSVAFTTAAVVIMMGFSIIFAADAEGIAAKLVRPIRHLLLDMLNTSRLELDKIRPEGQSELSQVFEIRTLQRTFLRLHGAVGSFSKFTPLEVVRHFLAEGKEAELGVTRRNVTIFFSDIAGWTTICESCSPKEVLVLLSEYFEAMVSIIIEEKGTMLEFIGDAIMAIWNAPNDVSDHSFRAMKASLRMENKLADLRVLWSQQGKPQIHARVGLHSADVWVGNLGSSLRMKYGVLGDGVNLASRLEELNKRYTTGILASEDSRKQDGVADAILTRPIDLVVVKGRKTSTAVHEVLCMRHAASPDKLSLAEVSTNAFKAYLERDFQGAVDLFRQIILMKGGSDTSSEILIKRCEKFQVDPPPEGWDGSEVLLEKSF